MSNTAPFVTAKLVNSTEESSLSEFVSNIAPVVATELVHNTTPTVNIHPMQTRSKSGIVSPLRLSLSNTAHFITTDLVHNTTPPVNTHLMQTRSKSDTAQHRIHPSILLPHLEPTSVKQALKDANLLAAMQQEYDALMLQNTWDLVTLPSNRQAVGCKWVSRVKENVDGSINKYKAQLVAKGWISSSPWF